jgi:hypothetical protein
LEEVAVHACRKVLMEVADNVLLITGDSQEILGSWLKPHPIHLYNITALIN